MSCLGVHFALTHEEATHVRSLREASRVEYLQEVIEETYFGEHPDLKAESDKSWDAMHRALGDGQLTGGGGEYPLQHVVLGGEPLDAAGYIMSLKSPEQARDIAAALPAITETTFRRRYYQINPKSYGFPLSEEDFGYTWECLQDVRELYRQAATLGRFVLFTAGQ